MPVRAEHVTAASQTGRAPAAGLEQPRSEGQGAGPQRRQS